MVFVWRQTIRVACTRATLLFAALLLAIVAAASGASAAEPPPKRAYHASVVNGDILGSAFMIEEGIVVTNAHVIAGRRAGQHIALIGPAGARQTARIEAISSQMDLAVLSVRIDGMRVVPKTRRHARRGVQVVAIGIVASSGNPHKRYSIRGTVASNLRAMAPFGRGVIVQMPLVRRGFSGGPVFDGSGGLVGMVSALRPAHASPTRGREAFILSAAEIRAEVDRLTSR